MNLFSQKGIQASVHRILKEKYDDRKKIVPKRAAFRRAGIPADRRAGAYPHAEPGQRSGSCRGAGASAKNRAERAAGEKRQTRLAAFPGPF